MKKVERERERERSFTAFIATCMHFSRRMFLYSARRYMAIAHMSICALNVRISDNRYILDVMLARIHACLVACIFALAQEV